MFEKIDYLDIKKDYLSGATVKIEKLQRMLTQMALR